MTPIQEAIQHLKSLISDRAAPNDLVHGMERGYENAVDYLESLLPKEKEFVGKCFDGAVKIAEDNVHWDKEELCKETDYSMIEKEKTYFLNKLYPQS